MKTFRCFAVGLLCLIAPISVVQADVRVSAPIAAPAKHPPVKHVGKSLHKPAPATKTRQRKTSDVVAAPLPKAKLDLSLPHDLVKTMQPPGKAAAAPVHDGLLPPLFPDKKDDSFQLNGRLLSNEMQLQLRDESRRQVEGAALDFEFKQ